jgi:hypothetical protein
MADWESHYAREHLSRGTFDFGSDTIRVILVGPSFDGHDQIEFVSGITTLDECTVSGYSSGHGASGRLEVTSLTGSEDWANDRYKWTTTATLGWTLAAGFTVNGIVVHIPGSTGDTDARILGFLDLTDTATNGGRITVSFTGNNVFYMSS